MDSQELIDMLAELNRDDGLASVVVTASMDKKGVLGVVSGVDDKLAAAIKTQRMPYPRVFGVADNQPILNNENRGLNDYKVGTLRPRLLGAKHFADLVASISHLPRGQRGIEPIAYHRVLTDYDVRSFEGREWLFDAVRDIMDKHDGGYIVLTAGPGFGKTAFLWRLVAEHHDHDRLLGRAGLGGWHFLRRGQASWRTPEAMVEQIEWRLRERMQCPLAEEKAKVPVGRENAAVVLDQAITAAGARLRRDAGNLPAGEQPQVLIVVDGIDEAFGANAYGDRAGLLPELFPRKLPAGVFVLMTSRPGEHLREWLTDPSLVELIDIDAHDEKAARYRQDNDADLLRYLRARLTPLLIDHPDNDIGAGEAETLAIDMADACEGTFWAADWYVRTAADLDKRPQLKRWIAHPEELPRGIDGMIREDWKWKISSLNGDNSCNMA